mmetsp:Transcript_21111/g.60249  ORF Transcript_21111/g.60249 Transcript_21111/m.60249 type:complete len:361 (-) Transcript_21111:963-2045(-)
MTAASAPMLVLDCIANVTSEIMLPAPSPTMEAPKMVPLLSTRNRTKPSVLSSKMARSLSLKCFSMILYSMPRSSRSLPYRPTLAISGLVNVAYGINKFDIFSLPKKSALRMKARAMKSAAWVNLKSEQQSPTPYTRELEVCNLSLTRMPFLVSYSTLASSKSMPVTFGRRPAATSNASKNISVEPLVAPFSRMVIFISGYPLSKTLPVSSIFVYFSTPNRNVTPSLIICCLTMSAMSSSSFGSTLPERPITDTAVPNRCIACASSIPMTPAPITTMFLGCFVMLKMVSFVMMIGRGCASVAGFVDWSYSSFNPGMGINVGYPPVAIAARLNCNVRPLTSMVRSDVNLPRPMKISTPNSFE